MNTPEKRILTIMMITLTALGAAAGSGRAAGVAARIGPTVISDKDLTVRVAEGLAKEQREFEASKRQLELRHARQQQAYKETVLNEMLAERVLALEAAALGTKLEDLTAKVPVPDVKPDEIRAFYIANKAHMSEPLSDVAPKIQDLLRVQAKERARAMYVKSLRDKYHATVEYEPARAKVAAIGPERGFADAPITIVEFSDFECSVCGRFELALRNMMDQYRGKIRLIYRHMPLRGVHSNAQRAAEAAVCAQYQGRFWEMHDLLFIEQNSLGIEQLKEKAKRIELDTAAFNSCLDEEKSKAAVAADLQAAEQLGIAGTPSSFVNGRYVDSTIPETEFAQLIDDEMTRLERNRGAGNR
jgi:protein-disulfide isomerase